MTQRTLVLLKPDAVRRGLIGEIVGRIERKADWTITAPSCARSTRRRWSSTTVSTRAARSTSRSSSSWRPAPSSLWWPKASG